MSAVTGHEDIVRIFDTTRRDGELSPGAVSALKEKLDVVHLFDQMGVDIIEAGCPISPPGDFVGVRREEKDRTVTARATDTLLAAANAYVSALNRLLVKREKQVPEALAR